MHPVPLDLVNHSRYSILEYIGSGGMGTVYKARHRIMDRLVALKIISLDLANRPAIIERFRHEVQAVPRLSHPNIVAAFDPDQVLRQGGQLDGHALPPPVLTAASDQACAFLRKAGPTCRSAAIPQAYAGCSW